MADILYPSRFEPPIGSINPIAGVKYARVDAPSYFSIKRKDYWDERVSDPIRQKYYNRVNFSVAQALGSVASFDGTTPVGAKAGNCFVVVVRANKTGGGIGTPVVTDTNGNTYTAALIKKNAGTTTALGIFYSNNVVLTLANTITCTIAGSTDFNVIEVIAYDVSGNTLYLDTTASGEATGTSVTTSSFSTSGLNSLIIGAWQPSSSNDNTVVADSTYVPVIVDAHVRALSVERVSDASLSGSTLTFNYSMSDEQTAALAVFKLSASAVVFSSVIIPEIIRPIRRFTQREEFRPIRLPDAPVAPTIGHTIYPDFFLGRRNRIESTEFRPITQPVIVQIPFTSTIYPSILFRPKRILESETFRPPRNIVVAVPTYFGFIGPSSFNKVNRRGGLLGESYTVPHTGLTGHFQVSDGYPIFIEPSLLTGSYEEVIDYGTIITNNIINLTWSVLPVVGSVSIVSKIAYSDDDITYSAFTTGTSAFAPSMRYAKIRLEFTGADTKSLIYFSNLQITLNVKREIDSGSVDCLAADVGGTVVSFNKSFKDIDSITVSPLATSRVFAVYDFVDIPNPTEFKILVFDSSGTRIDCTVSWKARGIV